MRGRWRIRLTLLGCGAVAATGLAPLGFWPLTLVGLTAGMAIVVAAETGRAAAYRAWWLGLGWFGLGLNWIVEPFLVDVATYGWMAPLALVLMAGGLARR